MFIYEENDNQYTVSQSQHEDMQRSSRSVNVYKIDIKQDKLVVSIVKSRYGAEIVVTKYKD